jgi:hypothetical protein
MSVAQWVLSPLNYSSHLLLPEGQHPLEVLKAWCGHLVPLGVIRFDRPPVRARCPVCAKVSEFRVMRVGREPWLAQCRARWRHIVVPAQVRVAQCSGRCTAVCGQPIEAAGLISVRDAKRVCSQCVGAAVARSEEQR